MGKTGVQVIRSYISRAIWLQSKSEGLCEHFQAWLGCLLQDRRKWGYGKRCAQCLSSLSFARSAISSRFYCCFVLWSVM